MTDGARDLSDQIKNMITEYLQRSLAIDSDDHSDGVTWRLELKPEQCDSSIVSDELRADLREWAESREYVQHVFVGEFVRPSKSWIFVSAMFEPEIPVMR